MGPGGQLEPGEEHFGGLRPKPGQQPQDHRGHLNEDSVLPNGYTVREQSMILDLGRKIDKLVQDFGMEAGSRKIVLRPQVVHMALNYVMRFHDARVNSIGDNYVETIRLIQELELRPEEPWKKEVDAIRGNK